MSDNKEQCHVKPWEDRMRDYFAQGDVQMRTPASFMADEILDWRAAQPVVLSDEDKLFQIIRSFGYTTKGQTDEIVAAILAAKEQA